MADMPVEAPRIEAVRVDAARRGRRLAAFALGTFHAIILVWLFVTLSFRNGSLGETLDNLDTAVGLALFAAIWMVVGAIGAIAVVRLPGGTSTDRIGIIRQGTLVGAAGGAAIGGLIAVILFFGAAIPAVASGGVSSAVGVAIAMVIAVAAIAAAGIVGGGLGWAFAMTDLALLEVSRLIAWERPRPRNLRRVIRLGGPRGGGESD
jgi:hypothetical protein